MARPDSIPILPVPGGMDNFHDSTHGAFQPQRASSKQWTSPERLKLVRDLDIDTVGNMDPRPGVAAVRTLTTPQGLWSIASRMFYQAAGVLYEYLTSNTQRTLVTGLVKRAVLVDHGGLIWGSDGTQNFVINGATVSVWGVPVPTVTITNTTGTLPPGRYLVQGSWSDAVGNEGGVSDLVSTTLVTAGAISVTALVPSGVTHLNIYASQGDQAHTSFVAKVPVASLPYTIAAPVSETDPPVTEQMTGPWAGLEGIASFRAFLLLWRDNVVVHSEAQEPHLFHADSIWSFPATVRAVAPVGDGVWVATAQGLWWVSGEDPASMIPLYKSSVVCAKGSLVVQGPTIQTLQTHDPVALFIAPTGLVAGLSGGVVVHLTQDVYHVGLVSQVSLAVAERNGTRQLFIASVT